MSSLKSLIQLWKIRCSFSFSTEFFMNQLCVCLCVCCACLCVCARVCACVCVNYLIFRTCGTPSCAILPKSKSQQIFRRENCLDQMFANFRRSVKEIFKIPAIEIRTFPLYTFEIVEYSCFLVHILNSYV